MKKSTYVLGGIEKSIADKSMWLGDKKVSNGNYTVYSSKVTLGQKLAITPAAIAIFEEYLINAVDQVIKSTSTEVSVEAYQDGSYRIVNVGSGFTVAFHETTKLWEPFILMAIMFQGTEVHKIKGSVTGGTNGAGAKLGVRNCEFVHLDTADGDYRYRQSFTYRPLKITDAELVKLTPYDPAGMPFVASQPVIEPSKERFTSVWFKPRYDMFGMGPTHIASMQQAALGRTVEMCAYIGPIKYNGKMLEINNLRSFAGAIAGYREYIEVTLDPDGNAGKIKELCRLDVYSCHPMQIVFAVRDRLETKTSWSIINGISLSGGSHIDYLYEKLDAELIGRLKKNNMNITPVAIHNLISIFVSWPVCSPGFGGQTKRSFTVGRDVLNRYVIPVAIFDKLEKAIMPGIKNQLFAENVKKTKEILNETMKIDSDTYNPARKAGGKERKKCIFCIFEGLSATGNIKRGLYDPKGSLSSDYVATYDLGGVPMNSRKQYYEHDGTMHMNEHLAANKVLQGMVKALGLQYGRRYTSWADIETLNYGQIVIMTDQDLDGAGNIRSLCLNFFEQWFPDLFKFGIIRAFQTPILRVFKGTKFIAEFYSEEKFNKWEGYDSSMTVQYYKGLAAHEECFLRKMFKDFDDKLQYFQLDDGAHDLFQLLFDKDTGRRKEAMRRDGQKIDLTDRVITCSDQLLGVYREFCNDRNLKHLLSAIDGLLDTRRRALWGAFSHFARSNAKQGTSKVAKALMAMTHYGGGDSFDGVVSGMAQNFVGSNRLPLFIGFGDLGSRAGKGDSNNFGAPRYTSVALNKVLVNALFPVDDRQLYQMRIEEGEATVPYHMCPVIPPIYESEVQPGFAWKIEVMAFNSIEIIDMMLALISGQPTGKLTYDTNGWKGRIVTIGENEYMLGTATVTGNNVVITELPLGMLSSKCTVALKKQYGVQVYDTSSGNNINIALNVTLAPTATLGKFTVEGELAHLVQLGLVKKIDHHLNYIDENDRVIEFGSYNELVLHWVPIRRDLYERRLKRLIYLLKLQIVRARQMNALSSRAKELGLDVEMPQEKMEEILHANGFLLINDPLLSRQLGTEMAVNLDLVGVDVTILDEPKQLQAENISYSYLLNMSFIHRSKANIERREKQIEKWLIELADIESKTVDDVWRIDLLNLRKVLEKHLPTMWSTLSSYEGIEE